MMAIEKINAANFEANVMKAGKPVLLDFFATWCGPCNMMAPTVEEIAAENPQYAVYKVDVDEQPQLAQAFGIVSIPTLIVIREGAVAGKSVGLRSKEQILSMLEG
jgi:thioredoxin 1